MNKWLIPMLLSHVVCANAHYTCPGEETTEQQVSSNFSSLQTVDTEIPGRVEDLFLITPGSTLKAQFGQGLSFDGNTLAVYSTNEGKTEETIFLYTRDKGVWSSTGSVSSPTTQPFEHFYLPVVDGNTLLVGAWGYCNTGSPGIDCAQGAAYVFEQDVVHPDQWSLVKQLDGGVLIGQRFGSQVAIEGDTIVVAATAEVVGGADRAGAVYIFERNQGGDSNWGLVKRLESEAETKVVGDFYGSEMMLVGDTLLVMGDDSSVIYEYNRHSGGQENWGFVQKLGVPNGQAFMGFDGDTLVLSIVDPCVSEEGRTFRLNFYERDQESGGWSLVQEIEQDYNTRLVRDLAVEGDTVIAHDRWYDHVAQVYTRDPSSGLWSLSLFLDSSNPLESHFGAIALHGGKALVSYPYESVDGIDDAGIIFYYDLGGQMNAGHSGAWYFPETSGQGQFIDIEPEKQFVFLGWFTYTHADSPDPNEQHWYTAEGRYSGNSAVLDLYESLGGGFDSSQAVTSTVIGQVNLSFSGCNQGQLSYRIDSQDLEGSFPLVRVIPGSGNGCESQSDSATQAVDVNLGMDGGWFDPATSGQGFFIDVHVNESGNDFIFISWFTYGDGTESGQRWLTAEGRLNGSQAELIIYETTGGSFDDPKPAQSTPVGEMLLDFSDCNHAVLTYELTAEGLDGMIPIQRVVPGGEKLCEELAGLQIK